MNTEEWLNKNEPEAKIALGKDNYKFITSIMEAYHKAKVKSITDEDIKNRAQSSQHNWDREVGFLKGVEWFKQKLLKD